MCISTVHLAFTRDDLTPPSIFFFLISSHPPYILYANNVFTLGDSGCTIRSWGSLLLEEPVTRSLFVVLIPSSRDIGPSGNKAASLSRRHFRARASPSFYNESIVTG